MFTTDYSDLQHKMSKGMRFFFFSLGFGLLLSACAQTNKIILETHAYYKRVFAGARQITVDTNGSEKEKSADTIYTIFIQVEKSKGVPVIDTVSVNKKIYKATVFPVQNDSLIGATRLGNKLIYLRNKSGRAWFWVSLSSIRRKVWNDAEKNIFLKGSIGKQPFRLRITNAIELTADIRL